MVRRRKLFIFLAMLGIAAALLLLSQRFVNAATCGITYYGGTPATWICDESGVWYFQDTAGGPYSLADLAAGGGASAFTDLTDVPASYLGEGGKVATVKGTEDGLEFTSAGSGDITSVGDCTSGAAFDGTQGDTLTFYNAGGNATLAYDGTQFNLSKMAHMVGIYNQMADDETTFNLAGTGDVVFRDAGVKRVEVDDSGSLNFYDVYGTVQGSVYGTPVTNYLSLFGASNISISANSIVSLASINSCVAIIGKYMEMSEVSAPAANPAANKGWIYVKDNSGTSDLYFEDDAGTVTELTAGGGTHAILSATHSDSTASAVTRGDIIVGTGASPTWDDLALGGAGTVPRSDGTDLKYSTSTFADTYGASQLLYSDGANNVKGLATANSGVLVTSAAGVPSIAAQIALANAVTGTLIYINDQETAAAFTADSTTAKTCALAANTYSFIQMKAWGYLAGTANTASTWNVWLADGTTQKSNKMVVDVPATGTGDSHGVPFYVETIFTQTSATNLQLSVDETVDGSTLNVQGFQVWGIR